MAKSRLGFHVQRPAYPSWLKDHVARSGAKYVKILNADLGEAEPFGLNLIYIGRLHFGTGEPDKELVWQGSAGAEAWWAMAGLRIRACPWINIWEGPNEPAIKSEEQAHVFVDFELRRIEILHAHELKAASGVFSTGCPYLSLWAILGYMLSDTDFLALHQYGMRTMSLTAPLNARHLLRHRKVIQALRDAGHRVPPILITETGIDFAGDSKNDGWRKWTTGPTDYLGQLAAYDRAVQEDAEVECILPFTWMHENWASFHIGSIMSGVLTDYMEAYNMELSEGDKRFIGDHLQRFVIPQNPEAALYKYGNARGWQPISPERPFWNKTWQIWYSPQDNTQHICYWEAGEGVRHFDRRN